MLIRGLLKNAGRVGVALTLMLFLGGLAGVSPVDATGTPSSSDKLLQQAEVDLNGDGKSEKITFDLNPKTHKFVITLAGSSQSGEYEDPPKGFAIVDIDQNDKYKEIVVMCPGSSDANVHYIFAYDGNNLNKIGQFTRFVEFPGHGMVRVEDHGGFWAVRDKYVLDKSNHTLKKVPQEFYYVGVPATVKKSFPLYATRDGKTVVANVRPGSQVLILLCAPFQEEKGPEWYLLKSETGLIGWAKEKIFQEHLDGIPWAG